MAIVAALLSLTFGDKTVFKAGHQPERETFLTLMRRPAKAAPEAAADARGSINLPLPSFRNANPSAEALSLGALIYGCRLENRDRLTAEELARCERIATVDLSTLKDGLPTTIKVPGPEWAGLRNSDLRARERNTADPCLAAKLTGTECIHNIIYGKGLW